jgi:aminoglycoside phosphotransferase (APT) family kinase protein
MRRSLTLNLTAALSERANLDVIQWLLRAPAPRRALRAQLQALLSAPARLERCRLTRARFKPGHRLTAYYDAFVRMEGPEGSCARPIAVTWRSNGDAARHQGGDDLARIHAEALRRGVAAPFRQLTTDLPEWSMHIQVSPLDARFPQLVRVSDPRHVREMLAAAHAADEVAPAPAPPSGYAVTPVRYHPGQRHVLRYAPLDAAKGGGGTVFAKLCTGEEGARTFRAASAAADWLAQHGAGVTAVRPLAYIAEDGVVLYPGRLGAPLSDRLRRPSQGTARCLERVGAALCALHHVPPALAGRLPRHVFAAEVSEIAREACDHIPALLPSLGAALGALLHRAQHVHEQLPRESATFAHGDFKSEHVWVAPGGPMLIDFDAACLADPAYDLGKFLADLQLWYATYDQSGPAQAQERFLLGYAPGAPPERLLRARVYEAVELLKIARRVPLFADDWASLTKRAIRRAQAVMNDLERTLGWPEMHEAYGT